MIKYHIAIYYIAYAIVKIRTIVQIITIAIAMPYIAMCRNMSTIVELCQHIILNCHIVPPVR